MVDTIEIARKGFRQKMGAYLVMTLLVAFTVGGYLVISSYWKDAFTVSSAAAEPLNFPYVKGTVLYAYWTNPPMAPDEEFPPPRKYAPIFNDVELGRIRELNSVLHLSVALDQKVFSRFGNRELLSIEDGAPLWQAIDLVSGRLPQNPGEILVSQEMAGAGVSPGQALTLKVPPSILPKDYRQDSVIVDVPDPQPLKRLTVTGVYKPFSSMISGFVGYLPVRRVADFPETNPKKIVMDWPVPNTIFLGLADPKRAERVLVDWKGLYRDFPLADPPLIPPVKAEWTPYLPEIMMQMAASEVATPLFTNTANAFGLGAIGIFSSMFVSFLDRRRELGIMKTVGIENSRTAGAVSMETVFAGILGTFLGIIAAVLVTGNYVKGVSGNPIAIPWTAVVAGATVSAFILAAATYIPKAMARQGTVMELLYGRPIPIFRDRR
jgi:hypothetical protein